MRAGVWWSAAALAFLAVTSALRTTQVEGASRTGRRLSTPATPEIGNSSDGISADSVSSTFRPRSSSRREEATLRDVKTRSQSRRPLQRTETNVETAQIQPREERNERHDSRRITSRTRSRTTESIAATEAPSARIDSVVRSRSRSNVRRTPTTSSTQAPFEVSSPVIDESNIEVSNLDDIIKTSPKENNSANQFRRRSSSVPNIESIPSKRLRGRINTRPNVKSLDLDVSGTTNTFSNLDKEPTTARNSADLRNSRKLRYKQRLSETDTNLTGEGITATNEVIKSSQKNDTITSQTENQTAVPILPELPKNTQSTQRSTEAAPLESITSKVQKVVRRPLTRGKNNFNPTPTLQKASKTKDEISDDDNYPESFKALIQAKNASTQVDSPSSESLTLKASQVYNTYVTSPQSSNTGSAINKYSRFRNKLNAQVEPKKASKEEDGTTTETSETLKKKKSEFRPRGTYNPRNRKLTSYTPSGTSPTIPNHTQSAAKQGYKYTRKFKVTSTELPKIENLEKPRTDPSNTEKKPLVRPSPYVRKNYSRKGLHNTTTTTTTESAPVTENLKSNSSASIKGKNVLPKLLPRTSYYARSRNLKNKISTTTEPTKESIDANQSLEKKTEATADKPLIFTLLKNPVDNDVTTEDQEVKKNDKEMFIIAVSSTESREQNIVNDMGDTAEESESKLVIDDSSTVKYHAIYKDPEINNQLENTEYIPVSTTPVVRNLKTLKSSRTRTKTYDKDEDIPFSVTPRSRERKLRKYSESFSKTTEASTNGITPEPEKSKSRFSSKFRASYLDKPFYKPTVPTITSSTAWLKFFVTDHELTKTVEEPYWFDGEDFPDVTTESMTRQNITAPSTITHESSIELVEGEEIDLGSDVKAISFTKPRSKLASADLRLSESLVKPSQILNVEATHHSPSVTVSIFDALAEILTSTPKPRPSSTTEVPQKQNINNDVIKSLNGVSNNVNVNSVRGLASPDTTSTTSADANTTAKPVQNTDQTPNVINRLSVGESTTQPLNTEDGIVTPVNIAQPTLFSTPTPLPTTPISARRPFAIKVLYSDPIDQSTTAPVTTSFQGSTDNPTTVYNTVSDLLLSSNNVVSSELTSMLSNNIQDIIKNMDDTSRNRLSLNMNELLKTLIPRALDRLATAVGDVDIIPNTTPFSLEDIRDTENVDINNNIVNGGVNILPSIVSRANVNNTSSTATIITVTASPTQAVNSSETTQRPTSTLSVSSTQTAPTDFDLVINLNTAPPTLPASTQSQSVAPSDLPVTETANTKSTDTLGIPVTDTTNEPQPRPFFTNFRFAEEPAISLHIESTKASKQIEPTRASLQVEPTERNENISPLQLWVLSKKARVLKMIEDIIRQHNNEIATATPVIDIIQTNNIPLSDRLTKIINTMTSTTPLTDSTSSENDVTSQVTVPFNMIPNSTPSIISRSGNSQSTISTSASFTTVPTETTTDTTFEDSNRNLDGSIETTVQENTETTTDSMATETTTQLNTDTIRNVDVTTSDTRTESTTTPTIQTKQNLVSSIQTGFVSTTIPKKDYVIFGILPNNTVVRKDPNDDVLESLTEASPYIIYGVLPNNTVIRKFPNGTRVPRIMQKIDVLPISPWSLRNPYSPIHNNPAIVRPKSNPIRVSTNTVTPTDTTNNGTDRLTTDTISSSALNIKDSSSLGITTATNKSPADKSTASHVLSLRTTTMLPSVDEILLNSISTAAKEEMVISSMTSSTGEPRILTLDIDPETKQIRTEKPDGGTGNAVFKFIPIDEVTVAPQNSNVLKLATKAAIMSTATETNTQTAQIQTSVTGASTTTIQGTTGTPVAIATTETIPPTVVTKTTTITPVITTIEQTTATTTIPRTTITPIPTTRLATTTLSSTTQAATTTSAPIVTTTLPPTTITASTITTEEEKRYQEDAQLLQLLLQGTRDPKNLNTLTTGTLFNDPTSTTSPPFVPLIAKQNEEAKLLQALLSAAGQNTNPITLPSIGGNLNIGGKSTTSRSIEADLKQLQEDTKLLKALLQATGQNPANFNLPTFDINTTTGETLPSTTTTTVMTTTSTTTPRPTTTPASTTTTRATTSFQTMTSIIADAKKIEEDTKLLQALLQAVGQSPTNFNPPIISGVTSNVRIASNPLTTSVGSNPTTPINLRPVYTSETTELPPPFFTLAPRNVPNTLQPVTTTEQVKISTTFTPRRRTTVRSVSTTLTARRAPASRVTSTTEIPSTSTFSVEEDLAFLTNLKSVLKANPNSEDPEGALANRIIALAVERSLNEIQSGTSTETRTGKKIGNNVNNIIPTTTRRTVNPITTTTIKTTTSITPRPTTTTPRPTTTTPRPTTTTPRPTTITPRLTTFRPITTVSANTPSLEDDIKQFQEDTKLLQALLQATGQDPSKFNLPTLPNLTGNDKVSSKIKPGVTGDLKVLSNLLASPSPLNEPFDSLSQKANGQTKTKNIDLTKPFGAKIAVKDNLKTIQDDEKLLKTLVKLQDVQETTTQRNKLALTGQTSDEALKKLLQQPKPTGMVSEATQTPMSLSTEFGKSNDALLAALLKEQGFGPTTASSLDEQLRLSALLNQVVVTPKARRTTTPAPPPPPQRRPILDGLAWLWQQWRETAPGPASPRPNRRPSPSASPSVSSSAATSNRVNWFGSGPFVGNADEKPTSNRIPLEPPAAVVSEQTPGRGQLVSAAINVTRAFSQFLGAAIQGAAQTVQNVIRAGQRVATDVYVSGSGGSG